MQKKWKASRFNLFYAQKDHNVNIFNSATGLWAVFTQKVADRIGQGHINRLPQSSIALAVKIGVIVPAGRNELKCYRESYKDRIRDRRSASYVCFLTYRCNLQCPYCFQAKLDQASDMSLDTCSGIIKAIQKKTLADKTRFLSIMLFGGEPLLRKKQGLTLLRELREWSVYHRINFKGAMSSNGVLFSEGAVSEYAPYLDVVQITLDGPKDIHDGLRIGWSGQPTYDRIIRAVKRLIKNDLNVNLRIQIQSPQMSRLPDVIRELKQHDLYASPKVHISFGVLEKYQGCRGCNESLYYADSNSKDSHSLFKEFERYLSPGLPRVQILPCIMTGSCLCVDPSGGLYKCVTLVGSGIGKVGSLSKSDEFVFDGGMVKYYRRDPVQFSDCNKCKYLPLCGGGCPTQAQNEWGSYDHSSCGISQQILDSRIRYAFRQKKEAMI